MLEGLVEERRWNITQLTYFFSASYSFPYSAGRKRASEGQDCAAAAGRRDAILMCARP